MKITFEKLDRGYLVTAEETDAPTERLAYESPAEAFSAVGQALGINLARGAAQTAPRAPVAPSPEPAYTEDDAQERLPPQAANEERRVAPATRRVGLMEPKKSGPPAGRLGGAR